MAPTQSRLFEPLNIGRLTLSSRIVMAPLGSPPSGEKFTVATDYYGPRACVPGTLIIGEGTFISARASGTPEPRAGIWSPDQIAAWKAVVESVHRSGSFIFLQLWALGRSADADTKQRDGTGDVVSSSAIPEQDGSVPRAMTEAEIHEYIDEYATAAKTAVLDAGFDGVELHGGNGSLIDQFTQDVVNRRDDRWGGSIENRSRFALEITRAVCAAVGNDRCAFRATPFSTYNSMGMGERTIPQFTHLIDGLRDLKLAYLHLVESRIAGRVDVEGGESLDVFIDQWAGTSPIILAGGYSPKSAREALDAVYEDKDVAIAFGRAFVTNPDLVQRLKDGTELA